MRQCDRYTLFVAALDKALVNGQLKKIAVDEFKDASESARLYKK